MSQQITKRFGTGEVSWRTGSEGPRHDPYSFEEWTWKRNGKKLVLHQGLGDWLEDDGVKFCRINGRDDENACQHEFEKLTGISLRTLERAIHRPKHCCGRPRIESMAGFPGETLYICRNCEEIVGGSFNENAII